MTAAALKVKFNLIQLDLMKKENLTPEFLKLNPQHTIPTLVDDDFSIWESKAIIIYLIDKYAKDDSLYPVDPKIMAIINQRFFFDMGTLSKSMGDYYFASFSGRQQDPEDFKKLEVAVGLLNIFLESTGYAAAKHLTVADLVLFATVSTLTNFGFEFTPYPQVEKWLELMNKTAPGVESNNAGLEIMKAFIQNKT